VLLLLLLLLLLCVCVELQTRECFIILKHNLKEAARLLEKRKIAREKKNTWRGQNKGRRRDEREIYYFALSWKRARPLFSLRLWVLANKKESATRQKKTKHTKAYQHIQK